LGLAAIHVTHDQEEAYAVADRLVVMRAGRIERNGAAAEVWGDPRSEFVARFLGHDNVLDALEASALGVGDGSRPVVVRESAIAVEDGTERRGQGLGGDGYDATVVEVRFRGATSRVTVAFDAIVGSGGPLALDYHTSRPPVSGERVCVVLDPAQVVTLEPSP